MRLIYFSKKVLLFFAAALLAVLLAASVIAVYLRTSFDVEKIRPALEQELSDLVKRPVTIKALDWTWVPKPTLTGKQVAINDTDGTSICTVPTLRAVISLKALWRRQLRIWK